MVSAKLTVDSVPVPQPSRQAAIPDTAVTQAFQALLQNALQTELPTGAGESVERPTAESGGAEKSAKQEKPADDRRPEDEEPNPELAVAAVPVQVEPAPEIAQEAVEEVQAAPVVPLLPQTAQATDQPEAQPQARQESGADVPILSAELIVDQAEELAAQVVVQTPQSEAEAQSRFEDMLAQASRQLQGNTETAQAIEAPVEEAAQSGEAETQTETGAFQAPQAHKAEDDDSEAAAALAAAQQPQAQPAETQAVGFETVDRQSLFPTPAEQIQAQVMENLENQRMEFHMQLQPQELGRVDVKMVLQGGRLAVEIIAASPKAAEALRGQTEGLVASMRMANVQLDSVQVVQQSQGQEEHMYGGFDMMGQPGQPGQQENTGSHPSHGAGITGEETAEPTAQTAPEQLLDTAV